jgi:hypothetical protein
MNVRTVALLVAALVVVTGLLVGVGLAGAGGYLWHDHNRAVETAEPTEATVTSSSVAVDRMGSDGPNYRPDVTYEYAVDGNTYRSSNVFPTPGRLWRSDRSWARDVVADYPEGETVTAYYDPDDPSQAFLVDDRTPLIPLVMVGLGGLAAVGSITTGIAAAVLFVFLSRRDGDGESNADAADE